MFQRNELIDQKNLVEGFTPLSQGVLDTLRSLQCRAVLICLLIFPTHLCLYIVYSCYLVLLYLHISKQVFYRYMDSYQILYP